MKLVQDENSTFTLMMKQYYAFKPMRVFVIFSTLICEISLILYLMVIPIQLAYHSLLTTPQNLEIQNDIDFVVCALFTYHIFLYFDSNIEKIIKSPNSVPRYHIRKLGKWSRLVNIELVYDIITWGISIFMSSPTQYSFQGRILQVIFFLKIYKIYKFHKKTVYTVIGTNFYPIYKIFFTIMVTFTVISYLSSIFYALDYYIYSNGGPIQGDIWLVGLGTEPNLIEKPFWVQLLMINYWAMGTSSTAAYGDICGLAPEQVIYNIFVLYFANFLYGWYLNNIQIIPKEIKERQRNILQQFSHFQKYNRLGRDNKKKTYKGKFDDQLYLKILCSIEYNETQKSTRKVIDESVPQKYLQQIKAQIYSQFFISQQQKLYQSKGFFYREETLLKVAKIINESFFEKNQNIYDYDYINPTDLIYINEGSIKLELPKELKHMVSVGKWKTDMFGEYSFITNQNIRVNAIAEEYLSAYIIKRQDYKSCLSFQDLQLFNLMFNKCLQLTEQRIQNDPYKIYIDSIEKTETPMIVNKSSRRHQKFLKIYNSKDQKRTQSERQNLKSKKIFINPNKNKHKTVGIQTQQEQINWQKQFESVVCL